MAAIGSALLGNVFGKTDLENMLRPDFDMVKDKIVYILLLLGLVLFPTSMMGGSTPVECQYCRGDDCLRLGERFTNDNRTDPENTRFWANKYCTINGHNMGEDEGMENFMLYFPYIVLGIAVALWGVEKFWYEVFLVPFKMKKFNLLLNKGHVGEQDCPQSREDESNGVFLKKSDATQMWALDHEAKQGFMDTRTRMDREDNNLKSSYSSPLHSSDVFEEFYGGEWRTTFRRRGCQGFFAAFIITKVLELLLSMALFCFMLYSGDLFGCLYSGDLFGPSGSFRNTFRQCSSTEFICNIHSYYYQCVGHPSKLYSWVMVIAAILCFFYIVAGFLALFWLASDRLMIRSLRHIFPIPGRFTRELVINCVKYTQKTDSQMNRATILGSGVKSKIHPNDQQKSCWTFPKGKDMTQGSDVEMVKDGDTNLKEVAIDDMGRDLELMLDLLTYTQGADIAIQVLNSISKSPEGFQGVLGPCVVDQDDEHFQGKLLREGSKLTVKIKVKNSPLRRALKVMHTEGVWGATEVKYVAELVSSKYMETTKAKGFNSVKIMDGEKFTLKMVTFDDLEVNETYQVKVSSIINGRVMKSQVFDVAAVVVEEKVAKDMEVENGVVGMEEAVENMGAVVEDAFMGTEMKVALMGTKMKVALMGTEMKVAQEAEVMDEVEEDMWAAVVATESEVLATESEVVGGGYGGDDCGYLGGGGVGNGGFVDDDFSGGGGGDDC